MRTAPDLKTLEAAAQWYVTLCEEGERAQAAHHQWLTQDPAHAQAWSRVTRLQDKLGSLSPGVARASLDGLQARRRAVLKVLALLLAAGGSAVIGAPYTPWRNALADLRTGVGERRAVTLADGSQLLLNTRTAVDLQYDAQQRLIVLREGEVMIQTQPDPRPFYVQTPAGRVQALGTQFLLRSDDQRSEVGVIEHAVRVQPQHLAGEGTRVEAGQQLSFSQAAVGMLQPLRSGAQAWTDGQLRVVDWRLDAFIAELSRYRAGHLGCDARAGALRISGTFQLDDTDRVLDNLSATLPVHTRWFSRWWGEVALV